MQLEPFRVQPTLLEWKREDYLISTHPALLDLDVIHGYLTRSTWAAGIPRETVQRSLANSFPFGLYKSGSQIGMARVTTDFATFAYLADVFILEEYRGQGLSRWLMEAVHAHPDLQGFRRWMLATSTAAGLYRKVGWSPAARPEIFMEITDPDIYKRPKPTGNG
ncbi:GNAT family N-acetyltransferase [Vitiosangium sp. GDMCC 1.1324]|uniref:GNAT family N-acetyltransferase n=1 Tax=Vitiosangium sp. (strain GDMCC 1.1324) TaxID=2138576 RepID=UPI000D33F723|nr:GNAT family N-acetyltransferase [Vitiosangium sp. GDMCC 1.1324]PTL76239.1 GNAT family N-acetyltransferase [Vitiosangium sp. GDMCC 1.1324]